MSLLWAQVPADALDGANRTLVYWLVFALFTGLGWSERMGGAFVLMWGVALAVIGLIALGQAAAAATAVGHFDQGRLAAPISYSDGDGALFLSACLPMLVLASLPHANAAWRVVACLAAVVLADLSVLCQSRGSLVWFPCTLVLYLAVARAKLRALAHVAIAAAAVAPAVPALLHVYSALVTGRYEPAVVEHAAAWISISAGLGVAGMLLLLFFERSVRLSARVRVIVGTGVLAVAAVAVLAGIVIALGSHPLTRAQREWHNFTTNRAVAPTKTLHFASGLGTSRYDVWRIALRQFEAHPFTGVGSDNYIVGYLRQRRTHETSRYPESLELRTLSETGVIGAALFLGFLALVLFRGVRAARRSRLPGLALACLVGSVYWVLHASTDWFWELPALTGAGLALLAISAAPARVESGRSGRPIAKAAGVAAAAAAALAAAATLAIPWASVSFVDAAVARGPGRSAYSLLDWAARLNPWSERPALAEATLAASAGNVVLERRALSEALRRNPYDWYPYLMLGIVAGREHRFAVARAELARARRLSPEDLIISYVQEHARADEPVSQRRIVQLLRRR